MTEHIDIETLEALALEQLGATETQEATAHVSACDECERELEWLRAERGLMARRSQPDVAINTWPRVVTGMDATASRRRLGRWFAFAGSGMLAAACAALLLIDTGSQRPEVALLFDASAQHEPLVDDKDPAAVLAQAEHEYDVALDTLAAAYDEKRKRLGDELPPEFDEQLRTVRGDLAKARTAAGDDVGARVAVLDAYAGYLHSMQDTVFGFEERLR